MWPGPSIGIIIKDLGRRRERERENERGVIGRGESCRCTSDVGLVLDPAAGWREEGAPCAGLSHNLKYIGARCLSTSR